MARDHIKAILRPCAIATASVILAGSAPPGHAQVVNRDSSLHARYLAAATVGTWFMTTPGGLTGLYTYHPDGTFTGVVSNIAGGPPQGEGVFSGSTDHGIWRVVRGGIESQAFRFLFDQATGAPVRVLQIRGFTTLDHGRDSASGTFLIERWDCADALSCPDPNRTPPDATDLAPPPPFNSFTMSRTRFR